MDKQYSANYGETGKREYVYFHPITNELLTLFNAPTEGYEDAFYDLSIEGNVVIMELYYIGEL